MLAPNAALLFEPLDGVDVKAGEGAPQTSRMEDMGKICWPLRDPSPIARTGVDD